MIKHQNSLRLIFAGFRIQFAWAREFTENGYLRGGCFGHLTFKPLGTTFNWHVYADFISLELYDYEQSKIILEKVIG